MRHFSDDDCQKIRLVIEKYGTTLGSTLGSRWSNLPAAQQEEVLNDYFLWLFRTTSVAFNLDDLLAHNRFGLLYKYANNRFISAYNKYVKEERHRADYVDHLNRTGKGYEVISEDFVVSDIDRIWAFAAQNFSTKEFGILQRAYDLGESHQEIATFYETTSSNVSTILKRLRDIIKSGLNP